jgi:hypothetical protein
LFFRPLNPGRRRRRKESLKKRKENTGKKERRRRRRKKRKESRKNHPERTSLNSNRWISTNGLCAFCADF